MAKDGIRPAAFSVPFRQAATVLSDKEDFAEYERAAQAARGKRAWSASSYVSDPETVAQSRRDTELVRRRDRLWRQLHRAIIRKLQCRELVAFGYLDPVSLTSTPVEIPADKWDLLTPDFENNAASGGGLSISGIRLSPPTPDGSQYRTGAPGRPGSRHLVESEFQRRLNDGRILATLKTQSESLAAWLEAEHPNAHPMKPSSIANVIRSAYNARRQEPTKPTIK